jgi:hypothetical protein
MEIFPDAKVVMTIRDNPEKWYDSVHGTIYQINLAAKSFPLNILTKLDGSADFHDMAGNLRKDGVPDGKLLLGTIPILRQHIFGLFLTHPPILCQHK